MDIAIYSRLACAVNSAFAIILISQFVKIRECHYSPSRPWIKKNIKNRKAALGIQIPFESRYVIFVHISQNPSIFAGKPTVQLKTGNSLGFQGSACCREAKPTPIPGRTQGRRKAGRGFTARVPGRPDHVNYFTIHCLLRVRRCTYK